MTDRHTIKSTDSDEQIARALCDEIIVKCDSRRPIKVTINHNIGPPKYEACPLYYSLRIGREVGIEHDDCTSVREWIVSALLRGYIVSRYSQRGFEGAVSVQRARETAKYHEGLARRTRNMDGDDDIPF